VLDAYLSPILLRYVAQVQRLGSPCPVRPPPTLPRSGRGSPLWQGVDLGPSRSLMGSHRRRADAAELFQGKDAMPVGARRVAWSAWRDRAGGGFDSPSAVDMGAHSPHVSAFRRRTSVAFETEVRACDAPHTRMLIHTVAAGGGSVCISTDVVASARAPIQPGPIRTQMFTAAAGRSP